MLINDNEVYLKRVYIYPSHMASEITKNVDKIQVNLESFIARVSI